MPHNEFSAPDVSEFIDRTSAIARSTRQRINDTSASTAEGATISREIIKGLQASYDKLAIWSDPFTVDKCAARFRSNDRIMNGRPKLAETDASVPSVLPRAPSELSHRGRTT